MSEKIHASAVDGEAIVAWLYDYLLKSHGFNEASIRDAVTFGDLGLTSAELLEMIYELSQWLGRDIEETLVFENPTINDLARALAA